MLKSGFYQTDITPWLGLNMPGYFHRRPAGDIFDRLYASAWVLDDGVKQIAVVSVDSIGVERELTLAIRNRVQAACGIPAPHIMVSATHTHTGGSVVKRKRFGAPEREYTDFLINRAADAVVLAQKNLAPCELFFNAGNLDGYSFCRIYKMKSGGLRTNPGMDNPDILGPYYDIDRGVTLIKIAVNGQVAGVVVNWANHCDVVGSEYGISADYPGRLRDRLKARYGEDTAVLFLQGACGNINHINPFDPATRDKQRYIAIGDALADTAIELADAAAKQDDPSVQIKTEYVTLNQRLPGEALLKWSAEVVSRVTYDASSLSGWNKDQIDLYFAEEALDTQKKGVSPIVCDLQVIKIGGLVVFTSPGELFNEYAQELKQKSPCAYTVVAAYTNDYRGYICAPGCDGPGVYEYRLKCGATLEDGAGAKMNRRLLAAAAELTDKISSTE